MRKVKDAKDLNDGSLIYFRGHAKVTYMSDGSTVEDSININKLFVEDNYYNKSNVDKKITEAITGGSVSLDGFATEQWVNAQGFLKEHQDISGKQDKLVSGTNIKTINGESILGEGDIIIEAGTGANLSNYATKEELNSKQDVISDIETIRQGAAKGTTSVQQGTLSMVATSGSYDDLTNKPTIPNAVSESTISSWGFTKNTGTYTKPSTGIPKSDLDSSVQTSLAKADTALQTETYKGTITGVSANGTSISTSGVANIPAASTSAYGVTKLSSSTSSTSTTLAATASAVKSAYDLANGKQDKLVSGTNIKTINGESLLGSGNITISGGSGSSSSGNGAYAEVNHGTSDTTFTLTPNTFHIWDEVSSLTLTIGSGTSGIANEYLFQFTSGSEPTTLILPDTIKFNSDFTIEENNIYQISILNGLGTIMSWEFTPNVVLITFYYSGSPYSAEKGMTWEQWCNSIYNSTLLKISGGMLMVNGIYPIYNSSGMLVYGTDVIIENEYYDIPQSGGGA